MDAEIYHAMFLLTKNAALTYFSLLTGVSNRFHNLQKCFFINMNRFHTDFTTDAEGHAQVRTSDVGLAGMFDALGSLPSDFEYERERQEHFERESQQQQHQHHRQQQQSQLAPSNIPVLTIH